MKRLYTLTVALAIAFCSLSAHFASASTTSSVILPNSDGNYLQFQPKTNGAAHYTMVNESLCNGTTNYNTATTVGLRDSYGTSIASIGNGALISQVGVVPCASLNTSGSATGSVFYRWNGADSTDKGNYKLTGTTPVQLSPTSTWPGLSLFKTSTSILEIGAVLSAETGTNGMRLSRIATVLTYSLTVPTAPSSLVATDASASQINLAWNDNSSNELGFKIYRKLNNGPFSQVATTVSWNATSYNDTGLTADQTYSYEVIAYNSAGTSTSNISTAITYSTVPTAPSNLTAVTSSNNVVLTWSDNSANEDGFKIERSTDNITYTQIATTVTNFSSTTSYTDVAQGGTAHYYRVKAYSTIGSSGYASAVEGIYKVTVNGIFTDTTWTPSNIYYVNTALSVTGATLTIQAGTIVKFDIGQAISVTSSGILKVQGTPSGKVYFTSYLDDSVGGDTNGDTTSTTPSASDWDNISINYGASSTIANAVVHYSGRFGHTALYTNGGTLTLDTTEIANSTFYCVYQVSGTTNILSSNLKGGASGSYGVYSLGGTLSVDNTAFSLYTSNGAYAQGSGSLTLTNDIFTNSAGGGAVQVDLSGGIAFTHSGSIAQGTPGYSGIAILGNLTADETITGGDLPYVIRNGLTVTSGRTFTIQPGAILKVDLAQNLNVGGTLVAEGTSASRIYFTAYTDDGSDVGGDTNGDGSASDPNSNHWDAIKVDSVNASSTISYALLRYGGNTCCGFSGSNIYNSGGTLTLSNDEVATSTNYGVRNDSGNVAITASIIHNQGAGLYVYGGTASVNGSAIYSNSTYGVNNNTGSAVDATNNWWGSTWGPRPTGSGDLINGNVTYDPWHHVNDPTSNSSVHNRQILWYGSSAYLSTWNTAVGIWNGTDAGIITVTSAASTSTAYLVISDTSTNAFPAKYYPGSVLGNPYDSIEISPNEMFNLTVIWFPDGGSAQTDALTHELGHGLGLGHSTNDDANNVMATSVHPRTTLGAADKSDYNFLWNVISWAIPY